MSAVDTIIFTLAILTIVGLVYLAYFIYFIFEMKKVIKGNKMREEVKVKRHI